MSFVPLCRHFYGLEIFLGIGRKKNAQAQNRFFLFRRMLKTNNFFLGNSVTNIFFSKKDLGTPKTIKWCAPKRSHRPLYLEGPAGIVSRGAVEC